MLELNPEIPNNFMVLDRHESFPAYYAAYGDQLAHHYEREGIIFFPYFPLKFDFDLMQMLTASEDSKKIGVANGIENPVLVRNGTELKVDKTHPFVQMWKDPMLAIYIHSQVVSVNAQVRLGMRTLFPRYFSLGEGNTTWRLSQSVNEGLHFDVFRGGIPMPVESKQFHRLKLFINIDSQPRVWRTSLPLRAVLKRFAHRLPPVLPDDLNIVNDIIGRSGVLPDLPTHTISFPSMSAVLADGGLMTHEVAFGRRMVAAEYFCPYTEMLNPEFAPINSLATWIREAGLEVAAPNDQRHALQWLTDAGITPQEPTYKPAGA